MNDENEEQEHQHQQVQNLPAVHEERPQRLPILAGGAVRAIVPQDFEGAYRMATMAVRGGLNVRGLETVEKCMVAILHGMEVGLTPMAAIQSIAVINGRPTIYGDGAIGLCLNAPVCEWIEETESGTFPNDDYKAICRAKRKGSPKITMGEFSIADAKQARLWDTREKVTRKGKNGNYEALNDSPWFKYPKRMLKFRARWALRDGFADVLKGLHLREEIEDMEPTPAEPPKEVRRAPAPPENQITTPAAAQAAVETAQEEKADPISSGPQTRRAPPPPAEDAFDEKLWLESLDNAFGACEDTFTLAQKQTEHMTPQKGKVSELGWKAAVAIINTHLKRVQEK